MIFDDDCWNIIKSYLFHKKDINYRLFIKNMKLSRSYISKQYKKEIMKWKMILLKDRLHEKYLEV
jgi:hypothetical protein